MDYLNITIQFIADYWFYAAGIVAMLCILLFTFLRRPKSTASSTGVYLKEPDLLTPPLGRPAYSDRMAYVLAEMSGLAYFPFEYSEDLIEDIVEKFRNQNVTNDQMIRDLLNEFSTKLMNERRSGTEKFRSILDKYGFFLVGVIDVQDTQGFMCKRNVNGEPPYLVLAFRGTEKKVADWLTNVRCSTTINGKSKVHSGFYGAFTENVDAEGRTVEDSVRCMLESQDSKDEEGNPLPLFITGHSLGGALALLATKLIAPDVNGACYTFGAPRIGNYEFFRFIKTPVYRVVNSSDIVPRVPPGAVMWLLRHIAKVGSSLTVFFPLLSSLFKNAEEWLDRLNGYRHHGDMRYLTDVAEGRFDTVQLLTNPPAVDRIIWMGQSISTSLRVTVKSHDMGIYRRKLARIASDRNE